MHHSFKAIAAQAPGHGNATVDVWLRRGDTAWDPTTTNDVLGPYRGEVLAQYHRYPDGGWAVVFPG